MPRSDDPYLQPNGTLRNKLGITDQALLSLAEADLVAARAKLLELNLPRPPFSFDTLKVIHHELFQDVYTWAGQAPEALRTNSRDIELGRSLHAWLGRLGIPIGGKSFKDVREQAERLSRCRLTFHIQQSGRSGLVNQNIVDTAMFVQDPAVAGQGSLFLGKRRLMAAY